MKMPEYIEREAALKAIKAICDKTQENLQNTIAMFGRNGKDYGVALGAVSWTGNSYGAVEGIPAADVAPVIRCKDCVYYYGNRGWCDMWEGYTEPDDFCSSANMKEETK
jgi:hypothetical protein